MDETVLSNICFLIVCALILLVFVLFFCCGCCDEDDRADQPAESAEQRIARAWAWAWAEWQALVAARAGAALAGKVAAPPVPLPLPYFPYAAQPQSDEPSETVVCAICLEPLRPGQLCSEVLPCHVFHGDCLGQWARTNGSCPLCRAKIVPGSDEVVVADDMV